MGETWFTSDTHFSHKNILLYQPAARPFATIEEMNEVLIGRWNSVVKKHDKVYHLGDFCMGGRANVAIAGLLNGQKRLIMGNHDTYGAKEYLKHFLSVHGALFWNDCILTHVPVHPDNLCNRSKYNIHGHLHSKYVSIADPITGVDYGKPDKRYICVSVEQNNLTLISADIILDKNK